MSSQSHRLRVGLIGCGRIARVHLRYLQQAAAVELVGFCDRDIARAREIRDRAAAGEVFSDAKDLLKRPLDVVHVLTPPAAHAETTIAALEHGVHVLVEKPMATTIAASERMQAAARQADRLLCVDHNRLFDPAVVQARELVTSGAIGTILSVEAYQGVNVQEGGPAATPHAMWLNLGPHPLCVLREFVGDVMELQACGGPLGELRAILKGSQALGSLFFSPATAPYLNAVTLYGTAGTMNLDLNTMTLIRRRQRRLPKMLAKAALNVDHALQLMAATARTTFRVATGRLGTYPGIGVVIQQFHEAVRSGSRPPVSASDGHAVVEMLERIWAQAQTTDAATVHRRRRGPSWLPGHEEATVLVTGATGFLGRRVVTQLSSQGLRVRAMTRSNAVPDPATDHNGVELVTAALGDNQSIARAVRGVRTVIHCAARVARPGSRADFFRDNVDGTAHLIAAAKAAGVERFIYVSSIAVYGAGKRTDAIKEEGGYDPNVELRGAYTWSKLEADRLVHEAGRNGHLRTVIVRPGIIVGPGGPEFKARLAIGPVRRRLMVVGRRRALLPLCHVDDVASAIVAAVTVDEARGAYNIVDGSLTQDEWLRGTLVRHRVVGVTYLPPFLLTIPAAVLELVYRMLGRSAPTLSRYKIRRATESVSHDTSRARRDLGWEPRNGVRSLIGASAGKRPVPAGRPVGRLAGASSRGDLS